MIADLILNYKIDAEISKDMHHLESKFIVPLI